MRRIKNYCMFLLLYACSLYHFVFSGMAVVISSSMWGNWGNDSIIENIGVQEYKLRINLMPVYGFETFTIMTCFMIFDYWLIRKTDYPEMNLQQFVSAFLFSQLAYLGYIYHFCKYINGIHAICDSMYFFFLDLPMLVVSFPLSLFIFKKRIKAIMVHQVTEYTLDDRKQFIIDYLIFLFISFACAIVAYWSNHYR